MRTGIALVRCSYGAVAVPVSGLVQSGCSLQSAVSSQRSAATAAWARRRGLSERQCGDRLSLSSTSSRSSSSMTQAREELLRARRVQLRVSSMPRTSIVWVKLDARLVSRSKWTFLFRFVGALVMAARLVDKVETALGRGSNAYIETLVQMASKTNEGGRRVRETTGPPMTLIRQRPTRWGTTPATLGSNRQMSRSSGVSHRRTDARPKPWLTPFRWKHEHSTGVL